MVDDNLLLIRNYDLWSELSDEEYDELNVVHNFLEAKKGEYIYFDSHFLNKLFFLKKGNIRIGYIDESGQEVIREIIQKGEVFGQLSLERNNLNGEFAQAHRADVSLCAFNIEDFQKILEKKPQIALRFSKQVGHKLQHLEFRLANLLNKDVKSRLIHFFFMLIRRPQKPDTDLVDMPNYLTHEDIAHLIGSSRQTVTTLVNELEQEGCLQFSRKRILIPSVKKLQNRLNVK